VICYTCQKPILGPYLSLINRAYHRDCVFCAGCKEKLEGAYQADSGQVYHPLCFQKKKGLVCTTCRQLLGPKWVVHNKQNYHPACLEKIIPDKCDYCGEGLVGRYFIDPWGQKVHARHRLKSCDCCQKILMKSGLAYSLGEGRYHCDSCQGSSVKSPSEVRVILGRLLEELNEIHITGLPRDVPVVVRGLRDLKALSRKHSDNPKGLTKTQIKTSLTGKNLSHEIYILYGLPHIEFKGVLAHELMHVWLHENRIKLNSAQTEGLCNMATFMVYSKDKSTLAKHLLEGMMKNPDPIYGQGYRSMLAQVQRTGWKNFLDELLVNKELNRSLWKKIFG
jgi:hypothetical protein